MDRPNLTVLTHALITRLVLEGGHARAVEIAHHGQILRIGADLEIILSLGAIHTPKVLMHSGIGDAAELRRVGVPVLQHLPGVGRNLQDHVGFDCVWEYQESLPPRNNMAEATIFWTSESDRDSPDIYACQAEVPKATPENSALFGLPAAGCTLFAALAQPHSRGRLRLDGSAPLDPIRIEANTLADPRDMAAALASVELCREIGNSAPMRPYVRREVMPGNLKGNGLETFIRNAADSYGHVTCTAKMGRDAMSVVDGNLKVYGVENLRVADGSIMPRITTGNTMAPCVVIGERAAEILKATHRL